MSPEPAGELADRIREFRAQRLSRHELSEWCAQSLRRLLDVELRADPDELEDSCSQAGQALRSKTEAGFPAVESNVYAVSLWCFAFCCTPRRSASRQTRTSTPPLERRSLADRTLADYLGQLLTFVDSIGDVSVWSVTTADVADFLGQCVSFGAFVRRRAAVYSLLQLPSIDRLFRLDLRDPDLDRTLNRSPAPVLLPADFKRLLAMTALPAESDEAWESGIQRVAAVLGHMGLRIGEVWRLELSDVDEREHGYLLIRRSKRGTTRYVFWHLFPAEWRAILLDYLHRRRSQATVGGWATTKVLVKPSGMPYPRPAAIADLVVPRLREVTEAPVTFHALRRSAANLLWVKGYDARTIAVVLGHASVWSTLWYLHLLDQPHLGQVSTWHPLSRDGPDLLTARDLATIAGVPPNTIRAWAQHHRWEGEDCDSTWIGRPQRVNDRGPTAWTYSLQEAGRLFAGELLGVRTVSP